MDVLRDDQTTRALGMRMVDNRIELHGVNQLGEAVLHGWFSHESGISILCAQSRCVIAMDSRCVSQAFVTELESLGHAAILVPGGDEIEDAPIWRAEDLSGIAIAAASGRRPRTFDQVPEFGLHG